MSKRMRLGGDAKIALRPDDNMVSYNAATDARSEHGTVRFVPMDRILPSRFQMRRVFTPMAVRELADSIERDGLIHEPRVRPHPEKPGNYELLPGERRLRALALLAEEGRGEAVLRRDADGTVRIPVMVEEVDDDRARMMVVAENLGREDLSAWEEALTYAEIQRWLEERGELSGARRVGELVPNRTWQTVAKYLAVARSLTVEVLLGAGVVHDGGPDHERLAMLDFAPLARVATAAESDVQTAAELLLAELAQAGDAVAQRRLRDQREQASRAPRRAIQPADRAFQINTRRPLGQLSPDQAAHYLGRIAPAVGVLVERAGTGLSDEEAAMLAAQLEDSVRRLRSRN
jgi:ParB/RepB/Spo0J family partition protein